MDFFKKITTETNDPEKRNAVIMGRKTWFSIPEKFRPLSKRINIILSGEMKEVPEGTYVARSLDEAVQLVSDGGELADKVESIHIIGGSSVYKEALASSHPCRIYFTRVFADFKCDTFLPEFDENKYQKLENMENIPTEIMTEKDINFRFEVYEKGEEAMSPNEHHQPAGGATTAKSVSQTVPLFDKVLLQQLTENGIRSCQTERGTVMESLRLNGKYFDVMAAMCSNRGFGYKGGLPWPSLRKEYEYYTTLTAKPYTEGKKCACIKGRSTWNSTDEKERQRKNVINVVISRNPDFLQYRCDLHHIASSFDDAVTYCFTSPLASEIDRVWILGGQDIYQTAVSHALCRRVYLTNIHKEFPSDRFFPLLGNRFKEIQTDEVDGEMTTENGISYEINVYERKTE